jgi:hypothetical protein
MDLTSPAPTIFALQPHSHRRRFAQAASRPPPAPNVATAPAVAACVHASALQPSPSVPAQSPERPVILTGKPGATVSTCGRRGAEGAACASIVPGTAAKTGARGPCGDREGYYARRRRLAKN